MTHLPESSARQPTPARTRRDTIAQISRRRWAFFSRICDDDDVKTRRKKVTREAHRRHHSTANNLHSPAAGYENPTNVKTTNVRDRKSVLTKTSEIECK